MPRIKKPQRTAYRDGVAPTAEWMAKHEHATTEAPRIVGHDHGNVRVVRKLSRAVSWHRYGWISDEQAKALIQWQDLEQACRFDHVRSCIDPSPRGFGGGEPSARTAMARKRADEVSKALTAKMHGMAWTVLEWLDSDERIDFLDAFGCNSAEAKTRGVSMMQAVADELKTLLK